MKTTPAVLGAAWGVGLLVAPARIKSLAGSGGLGREELTACRVLGARHLGEALLLLASGHRARRLIIVTETAHALSMLGLAARSRTFRRDALLSATVAGGLAVLTAVRNADPA